MPGTVLDPGEQNRQKVLHSWSRYCSGISPRRELSEKIENCQLLVKALREESRDEGYGARGGAGACRFQECGQEGLAEKQQWSQGLNSVPEGDGHVHIWRKCILGRGTASAKSLRQEHAWPFSTARRLCGCRKMRQKR